MFYLVKLNDLDFVLGEESLEVVFFNEVDILWDDLVFLIVIYILCCFFVDCVVGKFVDGSFCFYMFDIYKLMCLVMIDMLVMML